MSTTYLNSSSPLSAPMRAGNLTHIVDSIYHNSDPYQHIREIVQNSLEAAQPGSPLTVRIHPDWHYAALSKQIYGKAVYRLLIEDDGCGMDERQLLRFCVFALSGDSKVQSTTANHGIGGKTSTLPGNPFGLLIMSWVDSVGYMVKMIKDKATDEYRVQRWDMGDGSYSEVVAAPEEYSIDHHGFPRTHGTIIVCMGEGPQSDTYFNFPNRPTGTIHGLTDFVNGRFFSFTNEREVDVLVWEPLNRDESTWPASRSEVSGYNGAYRRARGQRYYLDRRVERNVATYEVVEGADVKYHVWTMPKDRENSVVSELPPGYIGVLSPNAYSVELYDTLGVSKGVGRFEQFGVYSKEARSRIVVLVEPDTTKVDIAPDLHRKGLSTKEGGLPWDKWGAAFRDVMPASVKAIIDEDLAASPSVEALIESLKTQLRDYQQQHSAGGLSGGKRPPRNPSEGSPRFPKDPSGTENGSSKTPKAGSKTPGLQASSLFDIQWVPGNETEERPRLALFQMGSKPCLTIFGDHKLVVDRYARWKAAYSYRNVPNLDALVERAVQEAILWTLSTTVLSALSFKGNRHWDSAAFDQALDSISLTVVGMSGTIEERIRNDLSAKRHLGVPKFPKASATTEVLNIDAEQLSSSEEASN